MTGVVNRPNGRIFFPSAWRLINDRGLYKAWQSAFMAFGLPALYETEIEVTGSRHAVRDAISGTLELLGWNFWVDEGSNLFIARVPMSVNSWGEEFVVSLAEEPVIKITSSCRVWQVFDWGRNRANIDRFLAIFGKRLSRVAALSGPPPLYLDEEGKTPIERVIEASDDPGNKHTIADDET